MEYYLQGFILGLAYVAPIGMQNLYVINTSLSTGLKQSLLLAWIVVFFDITLAAGCFFGIGYLLEQFLWLQMLLLAAGGIAVIKIGYELLISSPAADNSRIASSWLNAVKSACIVTWFNPQAILDGTLLLGGMKAALPAAAGEYFIAGVCSASCLWFTGLAVLVSLVKASFNEKVLFYINRICGIVIMFYGGKLLYHLLDIICQG